MKYASMDSEALEVAVHLRENPLRMKEDRRLTSHGKQAGKALVEWADEVNELWAHRELGELSEEDYYAEMRLRQGSELYERAMAYVQEHPYALTNLVELFYEY